MARSGILGNFSIRWNAEESRCVRWKGVITDMDEIAEMEERLELALVLTSHKNPTLAQLCLKFREENTFQTA